MSTCCDVGHHAPPPLKKTRKWKCDFSITTCKAGTIVQATWRGKERDGGRVGEPDIKILGRKSPLTAGPWITRFPTTSQLGTGTVTGPFQQSSHTREYAPEITEDNLKTVVSIHLKPIRNSVPRPANNTYNKKIYIEDCVENKRSAGWKCIHSTLPYYLSQWK